MVCQYNIPAENICIYKSGGSHRLLPTQQQVLRVATGVIVVPLRAVDLDLPALLLLLHVRRRWLLVPVLLQNYPELSGGKSCCGSLVHVMESLAIKGAMHMPAQQGSLLARHQPEGTCCHRQAIQCRQRGVEAHLALGGNIGVAASPSLPGAVVVPASRFGWCWLVFLALPASTRHVVW